MKHVYLVSLLGSLSVVSLTTATVRAAPAEEAPSRAAETGEDQDEETEEGLGEEEEYKNGLIFGFSHQFHLLRDRGDAIGSALGHKENLLGFMLAFERIFHPHVSVTLVKAFYFNQERLDSPFGILVNGLYRKNKWEPFLAAGVLTNIRVFYSVRDENGTAEKEFSVGLRFVAGFKYFVTPHWAVSFEFGYSFFPGSTTIEHEISDSYLGAYFF
jgi:hypothetical protein